MGKITANTMLVVLYQFVGICLLLSIFNVITVAAEAVAVVDVLIIVSVIITMIIAFVVSNGFCCCCC